MKAEELLTIRLIKNRINYIKNVGRIKSIETRCKRLLTLYYHIIMKY